MKLDEILGYLREIAPEDTAYENDPVGLHIEPGTREIERVAVCLDATLPVAEEAIGGGSELVIAHHPLIYHPLRRLSADIPSAEVAMALVRGRVGLYAMHTNWDAADGGINDTLAETLGLGNVRRLAEHGAASIARIGTAPEGTHLAAFAAQVGVKLGCAGINALRFGSTELQAFSRVHTVAVCGGAGGFLLQDVIRADAEVFVTSDVRHHEFLDAAAAGIALIDAGHEATETPGMKALAERLAGRFPELSVSFLPSAP